MDTPTTPKRTKKDPLNLDIMVIEATELKPQQLSLIGRLFTKKSIRDSYCTITIGERKYITSTISGEVDPIWNEDCSFLLKEMPQSLSIDLFQGYSTVPELIGSAEVNLTDEELQDIWCDLKEPGTLEYCGKVHILVSKSTRKQGLLRYYGKTLRTFPIRLSAGDILLFNTTFNSGNATKILTWSEWDHCALVVESPKKKLKLLEAIPDGVCLFNLNKRLKYYHTLSKVGARRIESVEKTPEMLEELYKFAKEIEDRPYKTLASVMEMVRALNQSNQSENFDSIFCSELVIGGLKRMGLVSEDTCSNNFLPRDLVNDEKLKLTRGKLGRLKIFPQQRVIQTVDKAQATTLP